MGKKREILEHSCLIPVFFIILIVLLSLRDVSIGRDLENYRNSFRLHASGSLQYVLEKEDTDILYWMLSWLIGQFTDSYQVYLTIVALITVVPMAIIYGQDRRHGFLKIVLFMNMSTFIMLFSGLRQAIAITVGLIAFECAKKKHFFRFLLAALIGMGFHHTGFMILAIYPLYHVTFKRKHLWFVVPAILLVFIFNEPIFGWATNLMNQLFGDKYLAEVEDTGAYTMLILFILFTVFAYIIPDEKQMDRETLGLRNILLAAVLLQCFAPIHMLAMRMNYYFIIFIPILMPKILSSVKSNFKDVAGIAKVIMIGFFMLYYLVTTYISCQTGQSALNTYPYVPFWQ
ncbi:MAG: EpsG family protein [Clostridia bacterium]|nr:EpsG family protein [Clostridia bacterium]